jgi:hypothetical protein
MKLSDFGRNDKNISRISSVRNFSSLKWFWGARTNTEIFLLLLFYLSAIGF